jgi:nitrate reductase beta subunit
LKSPAVSFGKKCSETENGQIAYSYVWLYDKEQGLEANKDTCEKIATKKD